MIWIFFSRILSTGETSQDSVDFVPLGKELTSNAGIFKLFSPGAAAGKKWMLYELGFSCNGKRYYLAGKKIISDDSGPALLSETTTLYTTLHIGSDTAGAIVAAGTLHLGTKELSDLLKTIHVSNATSTAESAQAVARFLRFFVGEFWHSFFDCRLAITQMAQLKDGTQIPGG